MNLRNIIHTFAEIGRELQYIKFRSFHKRIQQRVIFDPKRLDSIKNFHLKKEQEQEVDLFYLKNYGKKIDYTCHRTYAAYSGKFTPAFITEEIYIPELDHFMHMFGTYNSVFEDKNVMPNLAKAIGVKTPNVLFKCIKGFYLNTDNTPTDINLILEKLHNFGRIFIKPSIDSMGGRSCILANIKNGIDTKSQLTLSELLQQMGDDYVIQECLICHKSLQTIYSKSVNTFRVITYRWKDKIYLGPSVLRLGKGEMDVDNATQGGIFIGISPEGQLNEFAITKYGERFWKHPDTNVEFKTYNIPLFKRVTETALALHHSMPQIGISNWDLTIDPEGNIVLIEGNLQFGGVRLAQMACGLPAFGEHTAEMLQWLQKIKKMSPSERNKHAFGN
jgi:hypothetical protein